MIRNIQTDLGCFFVGGEHLFEGLQNVEAQVLLFVVQQFLGVLDQSMGGGKEMEKELGGIKKSGMEEGVGQRVGDEELLKVTEKDGIWMDKKIIKKKY